MCHLDKGCISGRNQHCAESAQSFNQTKGKGQIQSCGTIWDEKYLWLKTVVSEYKICTTPKPLVMKVQEETEYHTGLQAVLVLEC